MRFKDEWIDVTMKYPGTKDHQKLHFKHLQMESANRVGQKIAEFYGFRERADKTFQGEKVYGMEIIVISPRRYQEFIRNLKDMNLPKTDLKLIQAYLEQMEKPDQPL